MELKHAPDNRRPADFVVLIAPLWNMTKWIAALGLAMLVFRPLDASCHIQPFNSESSMSEGGGVFGMYEKKSGRI